MARRQLNKERQLRRTELDQFLTAREVAVWFGIHVNTVYRHPLRGLAKRVGVRTVRWPRGALLAWLDRNEAALGLDAPAIVQGRLLRPIAPLAAACGPATLPPASKRGRRASGRDKRRL